MKEKMMYLLEQLTWQDIPSKNSSNSHNPPAQDKFKPKRNQSLRKKTGRKTGGQTGHKGHTLQLVESPEETHHLQSNYCEKCGESLAAERQEFLSKRQVIELPPIVPKYIEYRQYGCACGCGHYQKSAYPSGVNAPIQYGASVVGLVAYFNVYQYVPYARLRQLFIDCFHLPISQGSIENLLTKAATKAQPFYEAILAQIEQASYVGSDETGAKVDGQKWWIWVWQNVQNTFLKASESRGFQTIEALFPNGLPNVTIGSDRWAAQLKINSKDKQLCLPHLFRDLNYLEAKEQHKWATDFRVLLKDTYELRHIAVLKNQAFAKENLDALEMEKRLNHLLLTSIDKELYPKTATLQKSMIKHRNFLFTCLYDLEVPPDNNASERAIRNIKVKQKISGQFKSGQDTFCVLRSIIDTLRKRKLDVFTFLNQIVAI